MSFNKKNIIDLSVLSSSEGISLIILFLTLPIISRIYDPSDFGNFEKYVVFIGIVANICLLNFEFKIYNFSTKRDQTLSLVTCLIFTTVFSSIYLFSAFLVYHFISSELLSSYKIIFLIFLWLISVSLSNITLTFFSSFGNFKKYSIIRLISTIILVASQIILGYLDFKFYGFVYAIILQNIFISFFGIIPIHNQIKIFKNDLKFIDVKNHIKNNKNIILFTFPGSFLNRITQALPVFFLAAFNPIYLGFYSFGNQILNYPLKIFNGVGNMYKKEFNDEVRSNKTYKKSFYKYLKIFSLVSFLLLIGTLLFADLLIPFIFGDKWIDAIIIIKFLSIMVSIRFIVASLSPVFILDYLPKFGILLQGFYFLISIIFIFVSKQISQNHMSIIIAYIFSSIIFYLIYFLAMKYFSNKPLKIL